MIPPEIEHRRSREREVEVRHPFLHTPSPESPTFKHATLEFVSDLLQRNVLVINQKAKLIELTDEYRIRDEEGNDIGYIREEGQSLVKKAARLVSDLDQFFTHRLSMYDGQGTKVVQLVRPRKIMKSRVEISDGSGLPVGTIV